MRNLVLLSDGTGGSLPGLAPDQAAASTNVVRLLGSIALDPARQLAWYDPGVGTSSRQRRAQVQERAGLTVLPSPDDGLLRWTAGQAAGLGLKENVRSLYRALAENYSVGNDHVFLLGFSRGAFTVRALAGLLYRCGLAQPGTADVDRVFDRSWRLFTVVRPSTAAMEEAWQLREGNWPCPIHFLGAWDTVKTYGGLYPVVLPHLRHNPDVTHVRHAMALHERRALFSATTWGRLDHDREHAMTRFPIAEREFIEHEQDIAEVWFAGVHDDVGSGPIALRWMLGEAAAVPSPLVLNDRGRSILATPDAKVTVGRSYSPAWWLLERLPRLEPDNSGDWPGRRWTRGSTRTRDIAGAVRDGHITVHATAAARASTMLPALPLRIAPEP